MTMNNLHAFEVKSIPPTNTRGLRFKIVSLRHPRDSITLAFEYNKGPIVDQAAEVLAGLGYTIEGKACGGWGPLGDLVLVKEFFAVKTRIKA